MQLFDSTVANTIKNAFLNWIVILDDGHGWETPGKRSADGSLRENEFNSSLESKLNLLLDGCEIEYYSLASGWADENLNKRSKLENHHYRFAQKEGKQTIGISIHADAYLPDLGANGFCVYYFKKGLAYSKKGKKFARYIADSITQSDFKHGHIITPRHDSGIQGENFHMLRETLGTWCLIENAFMTNDRDLSYLKRDDFRNHRAMAIFWALYNYITYA